MIDDDNRQLSNGVNGVHVAKISWNVNHKNMIDTMKELNCPTSQVFRPKLDIY